MLPGCVRADAAGLGATFFVVTDLAGTVGAEVVVRVFGCGCLIGALAAGAIFGLTEVLAGTFTADFAALDVVGVLDVAGLVAFVLDVAVGLDFCAAFILDGLFVFVVACFAAGVDLTAAFVVDLGTDFTAVLAGGVPTVAVAGLVGA